MRAVLLLLCLAAPLPAAERPNFLFVFSDDQRFDAMSCVQAEQKDKGRFPFIRTPNMDRLANEGIRFRNAFVVNSLCSPSRACFLTGQYSHTNGICNNRTPFPADAVTHASLLRQAGYATGYMGKWHHGNQSGQRPGFDFSASFTGQGVYNDVAFEINGVKTPSKGWADDTSTDYALDFIEKNKAKPFVCVVGFKAPHGPFTPPERTAKRYEGEMARVVPNLGVPPGFGTCKAKNVAPVEGKVPVNLDYFRCITANDDNLGRLLKKLDDLKLAENTVVVYSSDNGFYLGEHNLGDKRSAYDESLLIPFLVRYPRLVKPGQVRDEMVLNIDLAPTFLDLAGLTPPATMHGKSLKPLLKATEPVAFRDSFLYEYFFEAGPKGKAPGGVGGYSTPTITAVRRKASKLISYAGHPEWTEVFDLEADPFELKNLANDPKHAALRDNLAQELEKYKKDLAYRAPGGLDDPNAPDEPPVPVAKPLPGGLTLDLDYRKGEGKGFVPGRDGSKARSFDGLDSISVAKSDKTAIAGQPWQVEMVVKATQHNGVILARGGVSHGYAIFLKNGIPQAVVNISNKAHAISGSKAVTGNWATLTLRLDASKKLELIVDGQVVASKQLPSFIEKEPSDSLSVAADLGSPVDEQAAKTRFTGLIERVRLWRGAELPK